MAFDLTEFDADLIEALGDLPLTVTIRAKSYRCAASAMTDQAALILGGEKENLRWQLILRKADILPDFAGALPQQGEPVTLNGTEYRIQATTNDPTDPAVTFEIWEQPL